MKRYLITSCLILSFLCLHGQGEYLKDKIGSAELKQIKNNRLADIDLIVHTKDKITIIEFWETWCGPCIRAMQHLRIMKDKYPNELEIVCVSCDDLEKTVSFIEKNKFPFTFIYDKEKYLKEEVFPHSGIPHSILVDKTGKIQAGTSPNFITEDVINDLINEKQVDIPNKVLFAPENLSDEKSQNTLINFELRSYQLGDRGYLRTEQESHLKKVLTDFQGGYKDSIENIIKYTAAGKSILELYQIAYKNIPLTRFIYDKELNYINSYSPNRLYTMIFSSSDLLGEHHSILVNQLNSVFGLKTSVQKRESDVIVLDSFSTKKGNIKRAEGTQAGTSLTTSPLREYGIKASIVNAETIAKTLEDFFKLPVEPGVLSGFYDIEINIKEDEAKGVDAWIKLFNENGIVLRKDKKVLELIEISKQK